MTKTSSQSWGEHTPSFGVPLLTTIILPYDSIVTHAVPILNAPYLCNAVLSLVDQIDITARISIKFSRNVRLLG